MFDDLRQLTDDEPLFDSPKAEQSFEDEAPEPRVPRGYFLGMTPGQRFLLSLLLLGTVVILGLMCLMVTGKVFLF